MRYIKMQKKGRHYYEVDGLNFWQMKSRPFYMNQSNGKQTLLHRYLWEKENGPLAKTMAVIPLDGDWENFDLVNWQAQPRALNGKQYQSKYPMQEYNGVKFYQRQDNGYFQTKSKTDLGESFMHRYVWVHHNCKIPKGYVIHHVDHDRANNDLSNLQLMERGEHQSYHARVSNWPRSKENKAQLARVNHLAKAWHKSEEGRKWHSESAKKSWQRKRKVCAVCVYCGKNYETYRPTLSKYCSERCKNKSYTRSRSRISE